ncbi:MAG: PqqD family peptide modification chaperone [Gammaproteobacteria bacterium]|nr:PqqD family peptide modification chaperone [Gammaproteobacteria bacterium]
MSDGQISPHWYRVARLKLELHGQVDIHRHDYRGLIWYILEDKSSGRNHRFNPTAYLFIGMLNGENSVQDIFDKICEQLEDYAPGQEEIIQLIGQLHTADLIRADAQLDAEDLLERQIQQKQNKIKQRLMNPVSLKLPLWDPEDFLNRHINKTRWIFTGWVALLWILVMLTTCFMAARNWTDIEQYFGFNALSPYNLILMILLYPPIKFIHELGHAFAAKKEGGEIHEMGINFLMFMPIPYVNVSCAAHFRQRYKRMLVSAAGILVESFLAALGLILFLIVEPGIIQSIGFNIFLIGGVSSLFFNGNPLLKYDAYYILADFLSIPNLYQRASQYWRYFFQRYLLGLKQLNSPAKAEGETFWFITYSLSSQAYRLAVLWFIFVMLAEKFFLFAVIMTGWLFSLQVIFPLLKALSFLLFSPGLNHKRMRPLIASSALIALLVFVCGVISIPSYTLAEGIVWQSEKSLLKAEQDGFVEYIGAIDNQQIGAGTEIIRLNDPFIEAELKIAEASVRELKNRYRAKRVNNPIEAGVTRESLKIAKSELNHVIDKKNSMSITALNAGKLILPEEEDLPGRFVRQGELLGYVLDKPLSTIRMAISQDNIGQLRQKVEKISIRFATDLDQIYVAKIIRQAPEATNRLPSAVLSTAGGGKFLVRPGSENSLQISQNVFLIDLEFDPEEEKIALGTRAYVRISHGSEPVATQIFRRIRQVFLRQFNV